MGKSDRAFLVGALGLVTAVAWPPVPRVVAVGPLAAAALLTAGDLPSNRLRAALRELRRREVPWP